jgi:hypothetical protein
MLLNKERNKFKDEKVKDYYPSIYLKLRHSLDVVNLGAK